MSAPMDTGEDIVVHQMTLRPYINGIPRDVHKQIDHNSRIFYNPNDLFYSNIITNNNDKINDNIITNNKNTITNINNIITNDYPSSSVFGNNVVSYFDDLPPPPPSLTNLRLRRVEYNDDESDDDMPPLAPPSEPLSDPPEIESEPTLQRQYSSIDDHDLRPPPLSRSWTRHNNSNVTSDEEIDILDNSFLPAQNVRNEQHDESFDISFGTLTLRDEDVVLFYDNPEPDSKNNDNMFSPD